MQTLRARFKKDIVAEFLPPRRVRGKRRRRNGDRVVIFCTGMPSVPAVRQLLFFFSRKGYWAFHPRYRGSWESGGRFLRRSPENDIVDVIDELPRGFVSIFDKKKYRVKAESIYLFGTSFGGSAALLASRDRRVTKAIALSPVVDWKDHAKRGETIDWTKRFTREAFGEAYRFSDRDWNKLKTGKFYSPMSQADKINGQKLFIIHAKDDDVVRWRPVAKFAKLTGAKIMLLRRGGHGSSNWFTKPRFYKKISAFLRGV